MFWGCPGYPKGRGGIGKRRILYCLGDIVHNNKEVERLEKMGLVTIDHEQFAQLRDVKVLLRAHGEPPSTYETARKNNITLVDASCRLCYSCNPGLKTLMKNQKTRIHRLLCMVRPVMLK